MDDLEALKAALAARQPSPAPAAKAAHLRLAAENFARLHQETAPAPRPTSDRPTGAGFMTGVKRMLATLTTRPMLAATTSAAALALGVIVLLPIGKLIPPTLQPPAVQTPAVQIPAVQIPTVQPEATVAPGLAAPRTRSDEPVIAAGKAPDQGPPAPKLPAPARAPDPATDPATDLETDAMAAAGQSTATPALPDAARPAPALRRMSEDAAASVAAAPELRGPQGDAALMARDVGPAQSDGTMTMGLAAPMAQAAPASEAPALQPEPNTEAFANADQNPLKITAEFPVSTFSIDVDTASYAIVRQSLLAGYLPPPAAVRIEEMVNYFPYAYPLPEGDQAFRPTVTVLQTPWNPDTKLVHIALQGRLPALADRPPLNLVFLIDTSGSMEDANKLPLLVQSFRLMLGQLRPTDKVAIVTYAGSAGEVLPPTRASDAPKILAALENLAAGGGTAGQAGLQQAYSVAAGMAEDGEVTRVILATDGDFNLGLSDPDALKTFIADKRKTGTYLSVLGFGRGNLDDATMQALAQAGNGQAAYIDTLAEAQKVLVDQLTGALFPIADDVKIQVEWNPATVAEYRLIGYETRALNREDFNNDRVDAGEIGAGTSVTALYEITPTGSPAQLSDPLRYQAETAANTTTELGFLKLRLKAPGATQSTLIDTAIAPETGAPETGAPTDDIRFAVAIAGFGQLLTASPFLQNWGYKDAIALATGAKGADPYGYRAQAVTLMRLAQTLAQ